MVAIDLPCVALVIHILSDKLSKDFPNSDIGVFGKTETNQCHASIFQLGKQIAEKKTKTLITDGAPNFHEAYEQAFYTNIKLDRTEHTREIRLAGKVHNNKMERMNGEIRDRERCMRTFEKADTPILAGMQIFHNYIRPHEALKGKTPAEVAGIKVEGENKWLTLIQNASRETAKS